MALITIPGGFELPGVPAGLLGSFALTTAALLDAASEKVATAFVIPKTGNVRKIHWATLTVTTGATLDVRLETLSTSTVGAPSNTLVGTNTNGAQVVANGDDNTFFATTLTADAAVTSGQRAAVVIVNPLSSFGNLQIAATPVGADAALPYGAIDPSVATGTYAFGTNQGWHLMIALEYDDGTVVPISGIFPPATVATTNTYNTGSTPDVWGLRFQVPFPCRAAGAWVWSDTDGNYEVKLVSTAYNQGADTGVLARTGVIDAEERARAAGGILRLMFTTPYELVVATNYRLILEPTSGTSVTLYDFNTLGLLGLDAHPGGRNFHLTSAKDPTADGSWTNYNSGTFRRPMMGLLIDQFADDTGGASPAVGNSFGSLVVR